MTLFIIDLTDLKKMQEDLNNFIKSCEKINGNTEKRKKQFQKLGYSQHQVNEIVDILFRS